MKLFKTWCWAKSRMQRAVLTLVSAFHSSSILKAKHLSSRGYIFFHSVELAKKIVNQSLREKCPNTEFLLACIFPHSDWIQRDTISPYSVRMQENTEQKELRIWTLITKWIFGSVFVLSVALAHFALALETFRWLLFGNSWSGFFQGIACVIVWKHLILLHLWNGLQLLLSIDKSYAHSYSYRSKYHWDQYLPCIYCNHWLMTTLSHWDLFILFWEPFPSSLHELCGGNIFLLYLCNEPLASFRFDEKHDLLFLFLVSSVMEELWFDLILRYYMQQFHFAHDGQTGSHLCTSYRRTSNRLSQTNSASTLVPKSVA